MWSNALAREEQNDASHGAPPTYHQGYQQQPPPPPQQQNYPPPSPTQQQDHYYHDEYPDEDDDNGALSSTINLVTSGMSALFRSSQAPVADGTAAPPPPPPPQQPPTVDSSMPPPLQPETSMLSATSAAASQQPPPVGTMPTQQQSFPPPATDTAPPAASMPPTNTPFIHGGNFSVSTAAGAGFSAGPLVDTAPPVAHSFSGGIMAAAAGAPPTMMQAAAPVETGPPVNTNIASEPPAGTFAAATGFSTGPPVDTNETAGMQTNMMQQAAPLVNAGPPVGAAEFSAGPPVGTNQTTTVETTIMQPVAPPVGAGPPVTATAYSAGPPINSGMNNAAEPPSAGPPQTTSNAPPAADTNAFATAAPVNVHESTASSNIPPPLDATGTNAASIPPPVSIPPPASTAAPPTDVVSSPMPSPVMTSSLPSPSHSVASRTSSHGSGLPPRSTTPVSASSPRPRYKLPPLSLPRPHASPKPSPATKKWGGFKVPPPISTTRTKKTTIPGGITVKSAAPAPSPMASPRVDKTTPGSVAPAPSPFVAPPPANVTPVGAFSDSGFVQNAATQQASLDMPQLDTATPAVVEQDLKMAASSLVAKETEKVSPPAAEEGAPPPPLFVAAPPAPQESAPPPPMFVPAAGETTESMFGSATPPVGHVEEPTDSSPSPNPAQVDEPTSNESPVFVAVPPAAQIEETAPPPLFVAAEDVPPPVDGPAPPPFDAVSPEDERPRSDQQSERSGSMEYPEETAAQEDNVEPSPEEQHSYPVLPEPWSEEIDPASGNVYYYNPATGETRWDRPVIEDGGVDESPAQAVEDNTPTDNISPEQTHSQEEQAMDDHVAESPQEEEEESASQSQQALPAGWTEAVDPSSGTTYYYNSETGFSSWERPIVEGGRTDKEPPLVAEDEPPVVVESTLPDGWTEDIDEVSGRSYYYHADRNFTTWDRPIDETSVAEPDDVEDNTSQNSDASINEDDGEEERQTAVEREEIERTGPESAVRKASLDESETSQLPVGWSEHVDPASGKPYYVNSAENVTSWERPSMSHAGGDADDSQSVDDAITGPPLIARTAEQNETDSLPESTAFATAEEAMTSEVSEAAQSNQPGAVDALAESPPEDDNLVEGKSADLQSIEAEASVEDLPEEWEEIVDPDSGRVYYYNTVDGTSSWDRPVAAVPDQSQEIVDSEPERTSETELSNAPPKSVDSWNLVSSQGSLDAIGDHNTRSGDTKPDEKDESFSPGQAESEHTTEQAERDASSLPGLPPDWRELIDPASGNTYYLNEATNETTWNRPIIRAAEAEEANAHDEAVTATESEQPPSERRDADVVDPVDVSESEEVDLGAVSVEANFNESRDEGGSERDQSADEPEILPPGWSELIDSASGRAYYLNENDGTTTWERPVVDAGPYVEDENAPAVESPDVDSKDDAPLRTEDPVAIDNAAEKDLVPGLNYTHASDEALPSGWAQMKDTSSGRPYYVNEADNTTTWDTPVASALEVDAQVASGVTKEESEDTNEAGDDDTPHGEDSHAPPADIGKDDVKQSGEKAVESVLPPGWVQMTDPSSGNPYYLNETENVTTWDRPKPAAPAEPPSSIENLPIVQNETEEDIAEGYTMVEHSETVSQEEPESEDRSELPPGWVELVDEASGASYYFNEADNITTWDRPTVDEPKAKTGAEPSCSPRQPASDALVEEAPLQEGWSEIVDPGSGQTYYFNEETGVTTWDRPVAPVTSKSPDDTSKRTASSGHPPPARVFATFGFGGKLCVWRAMAPSTVVIHRTGDVLIDDPVVLAEQKKKENSIVGPLNSCEEGAVLTHIDSKATSGSRSGAPSTDILMSLALVAAKSNGRLRSDDGVRNPQSPEAGIVSLLLDDDDSYDGPSSSPNATGSHDESTGGEVASLSSLKNVEKLLLWGKREEAVQEAISSNNFAMALLVASMCDRSTFQDATKQFADEILSNGSPLHTLAMLFSGQLQPPSDSALDRRGTKPSIWDDGYENLSSNWRQHLAATISNRTLGWDRIVLSLGDHLLESGHVQAAHFCYMVCGCPVTSLLHPSSRMCLVGCDHVVTMDAALMTPEGVAGYERTEAYEWAKRRGNPSAAIPSLQPFKLMYAMLLADMGFERDALLYVKSIRRCCGLEELKKGYAVASVPSTVWALSIGGGFKDSLNEFEDRLCHGKYLSKAKIHSSLGGGVVADSGSRPFSSRDDTSSQPHVMKEKKKGKRACAKIVSPRRSSVGSMDTVSEDEAYIEPEGNHKDEDMNATFLSAQSNLLDVTASSAAETAGAPPQMQSSSMPPSGRHQTFVGASSREQKLGPGTIAKPAATGTPPMMMPSNAPSKVGTSTPAVPEAAKMDEMRKTIKQPPNSAPALLGANKKDKSVTGSPDKAPSSDKKGGWRFGIAEKMNKWLNPDATTADLGEGMQAYFDEKRKVWVFPGEDPDEVAKPVGPPPIPVAAPEKESPKAEAASTPADPLAAMMAPPPPRASLLRRSSSTMSTMENAGVHSFPRIPGMLPPGANAGPSPGGPPPQFTVFTPPTTTEQNKTEGKEE